MLGYYKDPEADRADARRPTAGSRPAISGYRDDDGFYFITGRLKELIIKGGENIAPREIDEALLKHPAVLEAAAVGIPGRALRPGHPRLRGAQAGRARATRQSCARTVSRELGRYKTPREFRFVAELPKGPSGKVQRLKLLELGAAG